jgi:hypothetical protein
LNWSLALSKEARVSVSAVFKADHDSVPARPSLSSFACAASASSFIRFTIESTSALRSEAKPVAALRTYAEILGIS